MLRQRRPGREILARGNREEKEQILRGLEAADIQENGFLPTSSMGICRRKDLTLKACIHKRGMPEGRGIFPSGEAL